jgi:hypothetical protein
MTHQELENKVLALEKQLASQKNTTTILLELERALRHRLKVLTGAGASGVYSGITHSQSLSGNPQSIDVLDTPDGYIPILFENAVRKVAFWN